MHFKQPDVTLQDLLERGVHFGHKSARWNPKMAPYIYKEHHGVHIIDLPQTLTCLARALEALYKTVLEGGRILFVGTKLPARDLIKEAALRCGQYYVNHRWLGGTLTNWHTISASLKKLREVESIIESPEFAAYTKKEQLGFRRSLDKFEQSLGGIKTMGGLPDMLFVLDTHKETIAVTEAKQLKIPIIAVIDTNSDPTGIDYPIPGNDDALRSIEFYCDIMARTVISGLQEELSQKNHEKPEIPKSAPSTEKLLSEFTSKFKS
jgi:small subunit ribosomal protein S2